MKISFLILFIAYLITYKYEPKSKLKVVLISIFLPIFYFILTLLILSANYGGYYAGSRIAGSVIPIFLSGLLLYINLNNKLKKREKKPYVLISLVIIFFILAVVETVVNTYNQNMIELPHNL